MKLQDDEAHETWKTCMIRFIKVLQIARKAQAKVVKYGDTKELYSYPPNAPRYKTVSQKPQRSSQSFGVQYREEESRGSNSSRLDPGCRNCGWGHILSDCPYRGILGCNTSFEKEWPESRMGLRWAAFGFRDVQFDRVLPGTADNFQLKSRDSRDYPEEESAPKRSRYEEDEDREIDGDVVGKSRKDLKEENRSVTKQE